MKRFLIVAVLLAQTAFAQVSQLRGFMVVAYDGTFLGTCENKYSTNSIANPYGPYGSKYKSESMANPYGQYGSPYASYSAYNKYASTPPFIVAGDPTLLSQLTSGTFKKGTDIGEALAKSGAYRLTKNISFTDRIDPDQFISVCSSF